MVVGKLFVGNSPFVVVVLTNLWTGKINEGNPIIYSDDDDNNLHSLANRNRMGRKTACIFWGANYFSQLYSTELVKT